MRHAPLIQVRDWQVVGSPFSREIMRSLFSGFRNIFARASTHAWPPPITERRMQFFETERNARRTRVVQSRTDCMNKQQNGTYMYERVIRTIYPTRIDFPLSSLQIWNTYVAAAATTTMTTLQGCKCALQELSPAGTAIAVLKTDRCFATRLLATIQGCWKI